MHWIDLRLGEHVEGYRYLRTVDAAPYSAPLGHEFMRKTCERWRRSLPVDGPTEHLHHFECEKVSDELRRLHALLARVQKESTGG